MIERPKRHSLPDVTVNSVSELQAFIVANKNDCEIPNKKLENLNRNFFRGEHKNFGSTALVPNVYRSQEYKRYETDILLELIANAPEIFSNKTTFEQLVLAQHYGAPTRLLDISSNPLIALFFACENYSDKNSIVDDGIIYRFVVSEPFIYWSNSKQVSFMANLSKLGSLYGNVGGDFRDRLEDLIKEARDYNDKNIFPDSGTDDEIKDRIKLIDYCGKSKVYDFLNDNEFNAINANINLQNIENVICVRPQNIDTRITNQSGYFFLFGENASLEYINPSIYRTQKIIIPAKNKEQILDELEFLNISPMTVYPDIYTKARFVGRLFEHKKDYFFEYNKQNEHFFTTI